MTVSVETMRMMAQMGLSLEQAIALAEQMERDHGPAQSTGAIRQRRYRERKASQKALQSDVTRDATNAVTKGGNGAPKEYIQTPSLPPKGSDADASGVAPTPPTAKQILWSKGKALLVDRSGMSKAQAGDLIGKWVGQWGVEAVLAKVEAAESEAENPKLWIAKALGREPKLAHVAEPNETTLTDWAAARFPRMRPDERLSWAREVLKPLAELPAETVAKGIRDGLAEKPRFINEVADLVASRAREWARLDGKPKVVPISQRSPDPAVKEISAEERAAVAAMMGDLANRMKVKSA